jgi:carotenoid cleavage dioxygenase
VTTIERNSLNPFLAGNLAPVHEEVTVTDLRVTGNIPTELTGRYLRNGPNPVGAVDEKTYHWFLGHGMVHGIRLDAGKATWYRNRWVRTKDVCDVLGGTPPPSDWPAGHPSFSANTSVIGHAGRTFAIVEGGSAPVELGYELDTVRVSSFEGTLPHAFSAHPKRDPKSGELHVMAYYWAWGNQVQYLVVGTDGRVRKQIDIPLPGGPMLHDLAITEKYVLIFDLPCVFNLDSAMKGVRFPYFWDHAYEARIGFLPREGVASDVRWVSIDPCYIYHPMNAYDDGDEVVLDAVRHPKMFDRERRGPSEGDPVLTRWRLNLATGAVRETTIDDRPQEFPRIREDLMGLPYRYGYAAGIGGGFAQDTLVKTDHHTGRVVARSDQPRFGYGEPVFVARAGGAAEDDGWVLALRHDTVSDTSDLAIFDAAALDADPVAVVHLPVRVPNGFHGNWIPDGQ